MTSHHLAAAVALAFASGAYAEAKDLPPPTFENVAVHIVMEDDGETIEVPQGARIAVSLPNRIVDFCNWEWTEKPEFLAPDGTDTAPMKDEGEIAERLGWATKFYFVRSAGKGRLTLVRTRLADQRPTGERFSVTIVAK